MTDLQKRRAQRLQQKIELQKTATKNIKILTKNNEIRHSLLIQLAKLDNDALRDIVKAKSVIEIEDIYAINKGNN